MNLPRSTGLLLALALVAGCGKKEEAPPPIEPTAPAEAPPAGEPPPPPPPFVGEVRRAGNAPEDLTGGAQFDLQTQDLPGTQLRFFHAVLYVERGDHPRDFQAISLLRMKDELPDPGAYPMNQATNHGFFISFVERAGADYTTLSRPDKGVLTLDTVTEDLVEGSFVFQGTATDAPTKETFSIHLTGEFRAARNPFEDLPIDMTM